MGSSPPPEGNYVSITGCAGNQRCVATGLDKIIPVIWMGAQHDFGHPGA